MFIVGYKLTPEPQIPASIGCAISKRGYQGALNYGQNGLLLLQQLITVINDSLGF